MPVKLAIPQELMNKLHKHNACGETTRNLIFDANNENIECAICHEVLVLLYVKE